MRVDDKRLLLRPKQLLTDVLCHEQRYVDLLLDTVLHDIKFTSSIYANYDDPNHTAKVVVYMEDMCPEDETAFVLKTGFTLLEYINDMCSIRGVSKW